MLTGSSSCTARNQDGGSGDAAPFARGELPWRNGSRLRARVLDGGDGALAFLGWHDSELDAHCTFRATADAILRCVPDEGDLAIGFIDAECRKPIGFRPAGTRTRFARVAVPGTCGLADDVRLNSYEATGPTTAPVTLFRGVESGCVPVTVQSGMDWTTVTAVSSERFVRGVSSTVRGTDTLAIHMIAADDGARYSLGFWDRSSSRRCWVAEDYVESRADRAPPVCLPIDLAWGEHCGAFNTPLCPRATLSWTFAARTCAVPAHIEVFAVTGPAPEAPLYGYCVAASPTPTSFPAVAAGSVGSGRLRALYRADSAGRLAAQENLFTDTAFSPPLRNLVARFVDRSLAATTCTLARFRDSPTSINAMRCLPDNAVPLAGEFYADAACTTRLHQHMPACASDPIPSHATRGQEAAYRILGAHSGASYYRTDASCTEQKAGAIPGLYALGPGDLATLVERIE